MRLYAVGPLQRLKLLDVDVLHGDAVSNGPVRWAKGVKIVGTTAAEGVNTSTPRHTQGRRRTAQKAIPAAPAACPMATKVGSTRTLHAR